MVLSEVDVLNAKYFALSTLRVSAIKIPTLSRRRRRSIDPELNFCICEFQRQALCLVQLRIQVFCREAHLWMYTPSGHFFWRQMLRFSSAQPFLMTLFYTRQTDLAMKMEVSLWKRGIAICANAFDIIYPKVSRRYILQSMVSPCFTLSLEPQIEGATNLLGVTVHSKESISHQPEPPITVYNHSRMVDRRSWDFFAFEHLRTFWKNRLEQEWNLWISHGYTLLRFGVGRSCS